LPLLKFQPLYKYMLLPQNYGGCSFIIRIFFPDRGLKYIKR